MREAYQDDIRRFVTDDLVFLDESIASKSLQSGLNSLSEAGAVL
jgi:hypothetical protein